MTPRDYLHLIIYTQPTKLPGSLEDHINTSHTYEDGRASQVPLTSCCACLGTRIANCLSVSHACCIGEQSLLLTRLFAGPNTEVRAKLKRIETSAAAAWLPSALTLFRDMCLMHDPDPCFCAAKSSGAAILASVSPIAMYRQECPGQTKADADTGQNRCPESY